MNSAMNGENMTTQNTTLVYDLDPIICMDVAAALAEMRVGRSRKFVGGLMRVKRVTKDSWYTYSGPRGYNESMSLAEMVEDIVDSAVAMGEDALSESES